METMPSYRQEIFKGEISKENKEIFSSEFEKHPWLHGNIDAVEKQFEDNIEKISILLASDNLGERKIQKLKFQKSLMEHRLKKVKGEQGDVKRHKNSLVNADMICNEMKNSTRQKEFSIFLRNTEQDSPVIEIPYYALKDKLIEKTGAFDNMPRIDGIRKEIFFTPDGSSVCKQFRVGLYVNEGSLFQFIPFQNEDAKIDSKNINDHFSNSIMDHQNYKTIIQCFHPYDSLVILHRELIMSESTKTRKIQQDDFISSLEVRDFSKNKTEWVIKKKDYFDSIKNFLAEEDIIIKRINQQKFGKEGLTLSFGVDLEILSSSVFSKFTKYQPEESSVQVTVKLLPEGNIDIVKIQNSY